MLEAIAGAVLALSYGGIAVVGARNVLRERRGSTAAARSAPAAGRPKPPSG